VDSVCGEVWEKKLYRLLRREGKETELEVWMMREEGLNLNAEKFWIGTRKTQIYVYLYIPL
jgi:hypothetical protein